MHHPAEYIRTDLSSDFHSCTDSCRFGAVFPNTVSGGMPPSFLEHGIDYIDENAQPVGNCTARGIVVKSNMFPVAKRNTRNAERYRFRFHALFGLYVASVFCGFAIFMKQWPALCAGLFSVCEYRKLFLISVCLPAYFSSACSRRFAFLRFD